MQGVFAGVRRDEGDEHSTPSQPKGKGKAERNEGDEHSTPSQARGAFQIEI